MVYQNQALAENQRILAPQLLAHGVEGGHGHLSGIIDWGDAAIMDRHYELDELCLEIPSDKVLLKRK